MQYTLIRARKRTLSLQVNGEGQLIARAPLYMPKFLIDRFIKEKSAWVEKRLADLSKPRPRKVRHFTPEALKKYITRVVKNYSVKMELEPSGIRFTQVKTYWGTCAPSGLLSFNLALCFAPKDAVSYVVVHELSHLKWRGHGKRFWAMVQKYYPKTKEMRKILRKVPRIL
ncbi:MAG: YgjP-like metallopeptidase domain-containing protein [bacterium]